MDSDNLLQEFPPVSTQAWEEVILRDLKGADYAKKLIWQTDEGIAVKPYYRSSDIENLEYLNATPDANPGVRYARPTGEWRIREEIEAAGLEEANRAALNAVVAGAEEISFRNVAVENNSDRPATGQPAGNSRPFRMRRRGADPPSAGDAREAAKGRSRFDWMEPAAQS